MRYNFQLYRRRSRRFSNPFLEIFKDIVDRGEKTGAREQHGDQQECMVSCSSHAPGSLVSQRLCLKIGARRSMAAIIF